MKDREGIGLYLYIFLLGIREFLIVGAFLVGFALLFLSPGIALHFGMTYFGVAHHIPSVIFFGGMCISVVGIIIYAMGQATYNAMLRGENRKD